MGKRWAALAALAVMLVWATAGGANAATVSQPVADGFAGPLQIAVGSNGTLYVAQDFAGTLTSISRKGRNDIVSAPGTEIAGIAATGNGQVFYTNNTGSESAPGDALLKRVLPNGRTKTVANIGAYEAAINPDHNSTYGLESISDECAAQWPPDFGPPQYTGSVDSHPYSVAIGDNGVYVGDAAGNDILFVNGSGAISTVAVLPPQPTVITAEAAAALGLPDCVIGLTYDFEPVPTDVEVGPGGLLYVSLLPGGPEDPSLGARGAVYSVNPVTGATNLIASGFAGATNLAVAPNGTIYVAELFADQIAVVQGGSTVATIPLSQPAAVEYANGMLYASTNVFGNGAVVTITP